MNNTMKVLIFLTIGLIQMTIGQVIGIHKGLEHMQHSSWVGYAFEAAFYSLFWAGIYAWFNSPSYEYEYESDIYVPKEEDKPRKDLNDLLN